MRIYKWPRMIWFFFFLLAANPAFAEESLKYSAEGMTFVELLDAGGIIMKVIMLISVFMFALAVFCFLWLRKKRYLPEDMKQMVIDQIQGNRFREAYLLCDGKNSPFCQIVYPGLKRVSLFVEETANEKATNYSLEVFYLIESIQKLFEATGTRVADKLRGLVFWFSNIGVLAPMLGLLGTVIGMIRAFGAIAYKVETGRPVLLSSAISQAMVTTAGGLVVGILCMALFYFLSSKANRIIHDLETGTEEIVDEIEQALRKRVS